MSQVCKFYNIGSSCKWMVQDVPSKVYKQGMKQCKHVNVKFYHVNFEVNCKFVLEKERKILLSIF